VQFGDGTHGTRLPTGSGNVEARYRVGLGTAGNVTAEQISMLLTRPPGLKAVTNPVAASGGTNAEAGDEARRNAPLRVRTLDRIVSLRDFEDFAAAFTGIGKAQAVWLWDGEQRMVHLTVAGTDGAPLDPNAALYRNLLAAIDSARPPLPATARQPLPRPALRPDRRLWIAPEYEPERVLAAAGKALETAFGFAARAFGQPVTGSEVLAALQGVAGVIGADLDQLIQVDAGPHRPHLKWPRRQHPGAQRPLAGQQPAAGRPAAARPGGSHPHGAHVMKLDADTLLALLPAFYRERDAEVAARCAPCSASSPARERSSTADIERLYDNAFIETCEDWVVPYIGDLLGVRALYPVGGTAAFGPRALVANTLRLRRRKGTALVLEELAFDTTGWRARAVEFFERVSTTQYLRHLRPHSLRTPDLRQPRPLDRIDGPFGTEATPPTSAPCRPAATTCRMSASSSGACRPTRCSAPPPAGDDAARLLHLRPARPRPAAVQPAAHRNRHQPSGRADQRPGSAALARPPRRTGSPPAGPDRWRRPGRPVFRRSWRRPGAARLDRRQGEVPVEHLVICDLSPIPTVVPEDWRHPPAS
jgi:hypothetical protein